MAQFQIDDMNGASVVVDLRFNTNPFADNDWSTVSGDTSILGVNAGTWSSDGLQNRLVMRDASGLQVCFFDINTAVSLSDPFSSVNVGDTGNAGLPSGAGQWTLLAKS